MFSPLGSFTLEVQGGSFTDSEIIVMLGQNGTGKTTFIRMLAGILPADGNVEVPELNVSYKPQKISPKFVGSVRMLLLKKIKTMFMHPQFQTDVVKPLQMEAIIDNDVRFCFLIKCSTASQTLEERESQMMTRYIHTG